MKREKYAEIVVEGVKHWWKMKRPNGWTIKKHLENPMINTTNESEMRLAGAIAKVFEAERDVDINR